METMNTGWFKDVLASKKMSQRKLASLMKMDPASVSLMFRGMRRMTNEEAYSLSVILGVKTTEVLRQAGVSVSDDVRHVKVTGYVDKDEVVTLFPRRTYDKVIGPADCPDGTYALQKRAPAHPHDGWMIFVSPSEDDPRGRMNELCCVALENGEHVIAHVQRGYRSGTFNLINSGTGEAVRTDAQIAWASRVLWIKPQ